MQPPKLSSRPPSTLEVLERIEAKLDRLERAVGPLADAPAIAGTAIDALDDMVRGEEAQIDARLHGAMALLERISRPQTLETLQRAVDMLESLPALVSTAVDAVDDVAGSEGVDLHGRLEAAMSLLGRMTDPRTLGLLERILEQVTDPTPVRTGVPLLDAHATDMEQLTREGLQLAGQMAMFLRHAQSSGDRRLGVFGMLKALRDPNAQRAMGFAMSVLEGFGQALEGQPPHRSLPA